MKPPDGFMIFRPNEAWSRITSELVRELENQNCLDPRGREALSEPSAPSTISGFKRHMDGIAETDGYLNDFHRSHSERLKEHLARQPKATLEEALAQYDRIKRGGSRRKP